MFDKILFSLFLLCFSLSEKKNHFIFRGFDFDSPKFQVDSQSKQFHHSFFRQKGTFFAEKNDVIGIKGFQIKFIVDLFPFHPFTDSYSSNLFPKQKIISTVQNVKRGHQFRIFSHPNLLFRMKFQHWNSYHTQGVLVRLASHFFSLVSTVAPSVLKSGKTLFWGFEFYDCSY